MNATRAPTGLLRAVVALIGVHSVLLGLAMLFFPMSFSKLVGFPPAASSFFPSQSGAFLLALGICYLLALRDRALVWTILVSKTVAVLFLLTHALFLDAPPSVLAAGVGDFAMLSATLWAMSVERPTTRHGSSTHG